MRSHAWVCAFQGLYNAYFAVYVSLLICFLALCFCIGISRVVYQRRELQTCPWRNFFVTDPKEKLEKYNPLCSFLSVFLLVKWKLTFSSFFRRGNHQLEKPKMVELIAGKLNKTILTVHYKRPLRKLTSLQVSTWN